MASTNKIVTQTNLLNVLQNALINGKIISFGETSVAIRNDKKKIFDKETNDEEYTIDEELVVEKLNVLLAESIASNFTVNVNSYTNFPNEYYAMVFQNAFFPFISLIPDDYYTAYATTANDPTAVANAFYFTPTSDIRGVYVRFDIDYTRNGGFTSQIPENFNFENYVLIDIKKVVGVNMYESISGTATGYENYKIFQVPPTPNDSVYGALTNFNYRKIFNDIFESNGQFIIQFQTSKQFYTNFEITNFMFRFYVYYIY